MQVTCISCKIILNFVPVPEPGDTLRVICSRCSCQMDLHTTQMGTPILSRVASPFFTGRGDFYGTPDSPRFGHEVMASNIQIMETPEQKVERLKRLLQLREEEEAFEQCAIIRDQIKELS